MGMIMGDVIIQILFCIVTVMKQVQLWDHCHVEAVISATINIISGLILKLMLMTWFYLWFIKCHWRMKLIGMRLSLLSIQINLRGAI